MARIRMTRLSTRVVVIIAFFILVVINVQLLRTPQEARTLQCNCNNEIRQEDGKSDSATTATTVSDSVKTAKTTPSHVAATAVKNEKDSSEDWGEHQLAVLVPFRDRYEELLQFTPHIHKFLNRQRIRHQIWVINQQDEYRFNRASLLNIGHLLTRGSCDYLVMHDVDLLPDNDELNYGYPEKGPFHVSSPELHPLYHYKTYIGGIFIMTKEQFEKVNGLSNLFWGWGREDDELYLRIKELNMLIFKPEGITTGYNTFLHIHDKNARPRDQKRYHNQYEMSRKRDRNTGLNDVKFTVLKHHNLTISGAPVNFVDVKLECDMSITPFCVNPV